MAWYEAFSDFLGGANSAAALFDSLTGTSTKRQYKYQKKLQEHQQNWLEEMSNTAHQREIADLKAAGINPLLTATGGAGASTPSSGMGSIGMQGIGDSGAMNSASALRLQRQMQEKQFELLDSQIDKNDADAEQARIASGNQTRLTDAQVSNLHSATALSSQQYDMNIPNETDAAQDAAISRSWYGRNISPYLRRIARDVGFTPAGAVNSAIALKNANRKTTHNHYGNRTYVDYRGK
ncbi:DNA pilot protein [Sigmofec virus UA08Rod_6051]|uniref:DNA pilot protein n=1 Tax=Sigmofec virus UA08Rod_6051 TaxID=2929449 RepID=A0A976N0E6_9VIRU|nr:DNA pilot protein [Sigmofec virus UA08Rod_6051]